MAGMLKKFVAGAAQTGAEILKQERVSAAETEKQLTLEQMRAQIQKDLLERQQEFLAGQQERELGARREMTTAQIEAQKQISSDKSAQDEQQHQERMEVLRRQLKAAEAAASRGDRAMGTDETGKVLLGHWDEATGKLMAGGKELKPLQKNNMEDAIKLLPQYIAAGDNDTALALADYIRASILGSNVKPGAAIQNDPRKPQAPVSNVREQPRQRQAPKDTGPNWIDVIALKNLAAQEPHTERGKAALKKLAEIEARRSDVDIGQSYGFGQGNVAAP